MLKGSDSPHFCALPHAYTESPGDIERANLLTLPYAYVECHKAETDPTSVPFHMHTRKALEKETVNLPTLSHAYMESQKADSLHVSALPHAYM